MNYRKNLLPIKSILFTLLFLMLSCASWAYGLQSIADLQTSHSNGMLRDTQVATLTNRGSGQPIYGMLAPNLHVHDTSCGSNSLMYITYDTMYYGVIGNTVWASPAIATTSPLRLGGNVLYQVIWNSLVSIVNSGGPVER